VRANYLYSGMADVAALTGDHALCRGDHENLGERRREETLPHRRRRRAGEGRGLRRRLRAAQRRLQRNLRRRRADDVEPPDVPAHRRRQVHGRVRAHGLQRLHQRRVAFSGDRFFYTNPLVYDGQAKNNYGFAGRAPWFGCACCPPNLMRTLAALTGYFYAVRDDSLYVNFYAQSEGEATVAGTTVKLTRRRTIRGRAGCSWPCGAGEADSSRCGCGSRAGCKAGRCRPTCMPMIPTGPRGGACSWRAPR
jgi:hypothetical protein